MSDDNRSARTVDARIDNARLAFEEAIAAFAQRLRLAGTERWDDLRSEEHYRAFAVAGAMKADLLADWPAGGALQQGEQWDWGALQLADLMEMELPPERAAHAAAAVRRLAAGEGFDIYYAAWVHCMRAMGRAIPPELTPKKRSGKEAAA